MYELIEHQEVGSGGAASITFSGIPQIYTDLYLVISARGSSGTAPGVLLKPNNSASNMTWRYLRGDGSSPATSSGSDSTIGVTDGSNPTASTFGSLSCYIPNYTASAAKPMSAESVTENNGTTAYQWMQANLWNDTTAISSIVLVLSIGNFEAGSSATLYGVGRKQAIGKPKASGGSISYENGYWYHRFTSSGAFVANEEITVDALIVAGGGGGGGNLNFGSDRGAGGGAGGYLTTRDTLAAGSYGVVVGSGGVGEDYESGTNGGSSSFYDTVAIGGGGGGGGGAGSPGQDGGSGGGGQVQSGTLRIGKGISGQGNNGGNGGTSSSYGGGGGGGAGAVGGNASTGEIGGTGGAGLQWLNGTYYAGGGAGGSSSGAALSGGVGGGGDSAQHGTANTGGGGGGMHYPSTPSVGNGGSGVVIVRYLA